MRLLDRLPAGDAPALVPPSGPVLCRDEVRRLALGHAAFLRQTVGCGTLLLRLADPLRLSILLLAADGAVGRMLLLPADLPGPVAAALAEKAGATHQVTDVEPVPGIPLLALPSGCGSPAVGDSAAATTAWLLATSGTTREPKLVSHCVDSLARTAKRDVARGAGVRWAMFYDLCRFAGLQVFFQALLGGGCLVLAEPAATTEAKVAHFTTAGCNAFSATPTLWRKILMTPGAESLRPEFVTLGGEIADQPVLNALKTRFPAAKLTHVYASTEAGVGFSVRDGFSGFPAAYLREGVAGAALRIGEGGILEIAPAGPRAAYVGEPGALVGNDGFVVTGDIVRMEGDRVHFLGRESGAINVGGNKVQPEEVERVLLAHPAVALAKVSGRKSPITGSLVEAAVVLQADSPVQVAELREWCAARLDRHQVPALMRIVPSLDLSSAGKLTR